MARLDPQSLAWMRTHHTTISVDQLGRYGVSPTQVRWLVRTGVLQRVVTGGYRFAGAVDSELVRCAGVCVARPHLVVAGPTSGRLWGIRRSPHDGLVHVIAPPASQPCRERWVRAYRTDLLHEDDVVERPDGIRLTHPARTLVDLTRYVGRDALASAIEHAASSRLCSFDRMALSAERLATPGRPWARRFLAVLAGRNPGAVRESDWERRVFDALVAGGVAGLVSQLREVLPGYGEARFDMAVPALRWVVEVDVHPEHRTLEGQVRDHRRDRAARRLGYLIERVGEAELRADFAGAIAALADSARRRAAELAAAPRPERCAQ